MSKFVPGDTVHTSTKRYFMRILREDDVACRCGRNCGIWEVEYLNSLHSTYYYGCDLTRATITLK